MNCPAYLSNTSGIKDGSLKQVGFTELGKSINLTYDSLKYLQSAAVNGLCYCDVKRPPSGRRFALQRPVDAGADQAEEVEVLEGVEAGRAGDLQMAVVPGGVDQQAIALDNGHGVDLRQGHRFIQLQAVSEGPQGDRAFGDHLVVFADVPQRCHVGEQAAFQIP